jgi:hypothetical protein
LIALNIPSARLIEPLKIFPHSVTG